MPLTRPLLCGYGVEDTPRWIGTSGKQGMGSGGPLVTLNLCVIRRYYLGEGDLVSTNTAFAATVLVYRSSKAKCDIELVSGVLLL